MNVWLRSTLPLLVIVLIVIPCAAEAELGNYYPLSFWEKLGWQEGPRGHSFRSSDLGKKGSERDFSDWIEGIDRTPIAARDGIELDAHKVEISDGLVNGKPGFILRSDKGNFTHVTYLKGWQHEAFLNRLRLKVQTARDQSFKLVFNPKAKMQEIAENNRERVLDLLSSGYLDYQGIFLDPNLVRFAPSQGVSSPRKTTQNLWAFYRGALFDRRLLEEASVRALIEKALSDRKYLVYSPSLDASSGGLRKAVTLSHWKLP